MYAMGRPHPRRQPSLRVLTLAASADGLFTDAEVFQELVHRYTAIRRWDDARPQFESFADLMRDRTEPIFLADVESAATLVSRMPTLTARDLIHLAVMQRVGARHIVTADAAFDGIQEIERLDPARVDEWRGLVNS